MNAKQVEAYAESKLRFLKQFAIYPKKNEREHMLSLKTEYQVDTYYRTLIDKYL